MTTLTDYPTTTISGREPESGAFLVRVQPDGRAAELVIDTGLRLRSGKNWHAYAKVLCSDVFHAEMMAERLRKRLGDAIEEARREAYRCGYRDARSRRRPRREFSRNL